MLQIDGKLKNGYNTHDERIMLVLFAYLIKDIGAWLGR